MDAIREVDEMSREAPQEDIQAWPPEKDSSSWVSDSGDSFLQDVLHAEPSSRLPVPGQWLGGADGRRFELFEPMGRGGMGQVFRARDATLGREVALKFLLPRPGFEALVLAEARAVARLDHENIVRIFDVAEWSRVPGQLRVPFLVMECLEGESLARLLEHERPELRRALDLLKAIAAGLAHAHERGIVHRDLKPGNVFLTRQGAVKLLDFGLSHLTREPVRSALQLAGGTPAYMAPEQWRGEAQDARTDIWAAGVVLYELLTGELPFQGATPAELRARVTSSEPAPPVRVRHPELPRQVEALLATALAKEPARRFASALELREELRELRGRLFGTGREARGPSTELQRRQVTLVSCQLSGFSEGGAPLDTEDVGELELAFHEASVEVIERNEGSVALSMGGEVLASFGWTQGREDDSERAVRAGLQLTRELRDTLQRRLPHLPLSGLSVRGGVHTELMVVGPRLQGEAPKVAAWLAHRGGPGELVVSDSTWTLVRLSFLGESLGAQDFEGLSGRMHLEAHRVSREREVASRFERARLAGSLSPLVGRERELEWLLELWERARRGQGAFVLVSGEAGIGKSRLIEALRERIPKPVRLCRMQCWSRFSTQSLHPIIELLLGLVDAGPEQPPLERLRRLEARMKELGQSEEDTHLLALLLELPVPEDSPVLRLTPERRKERSFEALVHLLVQCTCDDAPVLLIIEDLHWADSCLLEFLGVLLERSAGAQILVVLSARPEFQPDWPPRDVFYRLTLERLPSELSAELVREVSRGHALTEEAVQGLVKRTDGIPLFIEEMTRMALEGGAAASIPLSLHELLLARLDMLPSRQKSLAQLGAVLGREFAYDLLAAVAERDEELLRRELAGLVDAGLLRQGDCVKGLAYEFRHALLQEAAYQSLSRKTRMSHHRRIVRVVAERFPGLVEAKPEVFAYHLTESGQPAPAVGHWTRAGQLAIHRGAYPEAQSHLSRALELVPALPDAAQRLQEELRILTFLGMAMTLLQGYSTPEVQRLNDRFHELIPQVGEALPRLELQWWEPFSNYYARSEFQRAYELAERLVDLGRRHGDRGLLALGHRIMASTLGLWGRQRESLEYLERALACSEFTLEQHRRLAAQYWGEPRTTALAYGSIVQALLGRMEESRRWGQEALALAGRVGHPNTTAFALFYTAVGCCLRREPAEVLRLTDKVIELASERSFRIWHMLALVFRGWALSELGHPREGSELIQQQLASSRVMGFLTSCPSQQLLFADCLLKLGRVREALDAIQEGLTSSAVTGERNADSGLHRLWGECLLRWGRQREAKYRFIRAIAIAREQGAGLFELRATVSLCQLLRDLGRPEAARRMLERACGRFEAGGECVDLQEARVLLASLSRAEVRVLP
ncbi:protein kinase domain-containing protein [Archangium lansingense]|uniref:Protein kinase n=1 Tax=Archangium lansingense TaxID=2995310 RepID=A0ABT3ZUK4_9BACT|nr:protein kinase [Archangium lansinium]MCY1073077.1 protein kinase [Archangium lansinium]